MSHTQSRSALFRQLLLAFWLISLLPLLAVGLSVWFLGFGVLLPATLIAVLTVACLAPLTARWLSEPVSRLIDQMVALADADFKQIIPSLPAVQQRLAIEAAVDRATAAIIHAPIDSYTTGDAVAQAAAAGIPVITTDTRLATVERITAHIGADNYQAARRGADTLAELLDQTGKVLMLVASHTHPESLEREKGFRDGIAMHPGIEIVAVQSYESNAERARQIVERALQRWPELNAIYASNEDGTCGALTALRAGGRAGEVKLIGWDVTPELVTALQAGHIAALLVQDVYRIGYTSVYAAVASLQKQALPPALEIPVLVVRRDDLARSDVQEVLDPHGSPHDLPLLPRYEQPREISFIGKRSDHAVFRMMKLGALRAASDLGVVIRWDGGKGEDDLNELGDLGRAFNRLLLQSKTAQERLAHINEELEQQVAHRTADLEQSMAAIHAQAEQQQELLDTIRAMANPIIPVAAGVIVLPLVGAFDTDRMQQVQAALLAGVSSHAARAVIVDITGVSGINTDVAASLLDITRAVRLLGAYSVLTGIRPDVAQTIVGLGIDLGALDTARDLQDAIQQALRKTGRAALLNVA